MSGEEVWGLFSSGESEGGEGNGGGEGKTKKKVRGEGEREKESLKWVNNKKKEERER